MIVKMNNRKRYFYGRGAVNFVGSKANHAFFS